MRVMLVPLPPDPNFTGDDGNLRILAGTLRASSRKRWRGRPRAEAIEGPNVRGFYVKGIDQQPEAG